MADPGNLYWRGHALAGPRERFGEDLAVAADRASPVARSGLNADWQTLHAPSLSFNLRRGGGTAFDT
jgi:hypothetical protein